MEDRNKRAIGREKRIRNREKRRIRESLDFGERRAGKDLPVGTFGTVGVESAPDVSSYLETLRDLAGQEQVLTPEEQEALTITRQRAEQGLDPAYLQAIREQGESGLNNQLQTSLRSLLGTQAMRGLRGGVALGGMENLAQSRMLEQASLERDLMAKNIEEKNRNEGSLIDLLTKSGQTSAERKAGYLSNYGENLTAEEKARREREGFNIGQRQNEALARLGLQENYAGALQSGIAGEKGRRRAERRDRRFNQFLEKFRSPQTSSTESVAI